MVVKELFEEINGIFEDAEKSADYTAESTMKRIYNDLKAFLKKEPIFKTYFLRECRKRRVFLIEDSNDLIGGSLKQVVKLILEDEKDALERALPDED